MPFSREVFSEVTRLNSLYGYMFRLENGYTICSRSLENGAVFAKTMCTIKVLLHLPLIAIKIRIPAMQRLRNSVFCLIATRFLLLILCSCLLLSDE